MNRGRAILAACILFAAAAAWFIFRVASTQPSLPKLTIKVTGAPGQTFTGLFRAYGGETRFSGVVPAEYSFDSTPVVFRVCMTGPAGALTNIVYRDGQVSGGNHTTSTAEGLEVERDGEGGLSLSSVPTNVLLRIGDVVITK